MKKQYKLIPIIKATGEPPLNFYLVDTKSVAYPHAYHIKYNEVIKMNGYGEKSGDLYHAKGNKFSYKKDCYKLIASTYKIKGVRTFKNTIEEIYLMYQKLGDIKKHYTEEDLINACRYGYYFNQTSQFPKDEFEKACINNIKQKIQSDKTKYREIFCEIDEVYLHTQPSKVKITKLYL